MKSHLQSVVQSILFVLVLSISSSAMAQGFHPISFVEIPSVSVKNSEESEPLANLFLQLMTRPGVTDSSDISALRSAAQGAALSFRQSMFHGPGSIVKWARFRKDVVFILQTYQKEYGLAPEGLAVAEAKGAALDHLLDGLIQASVRAGISLEEFDAALLKGAATIETLISKRPLSMKLSLTDRKLVIFLLRGCVAQVRHRTFLDSTMDALQRLHAPEEYTTHYESKIYNVLRPTLSRELVGLEKMLADPLFVSDLQRILTAEFNNEVICDLFAMKYGFMLYSLSYDQQNVLISSLAALIPGMTPEILREQLGQAPGTAIAAYLSVSPQTHLTYLPVSGLADRLAMLGETPPTPPVFSLFSDPYQALIQMQYDIRLCDMITSREWSMANNAIQDLTRPLSLTEQMMLKKAAMKRRSQVRANLEGMPVEIIDSLLTLMESSFNMRI